MKEATGELSGTVITVVAIAAVVALFTTLLLPMIKRNIQLGTACDAANGGTYNTTNDDGSKIECSGGNCTYTFGSTTATKQCES